jgi:transcriptional regulator with XRE-family HTH domain
LRTIVIRVNPRTVSRTRENLGLTQTELAHRAGISPSYASMIERGLRTSLSPHVAGRLADVLGVNIDLLRQVGPRLARPPGRETAPTEAGAVLPHPR